MIKPEFFDDTDIGDLSLGARLFFIGLWTQADREGRLQDDARRLKARLFPYDNVDVEALIEELHVKDMVRRYKDAEGNRLIWVKRFAKHQRPHHKESESVIAACMESEGQHPGKAGACPGKASISPLDSGSLILESGTRNLEAVAPTNGADVRDERFDRFWAAYPAKKGKKAAWQEWRKLRPGNALAETIIAAVQAQAGWPDWLRDGGQYIPNPATWLHQGRWDDEPKFRVLPLLGKQTTMLASALASIKAGES